MTEGVVTGHTNMVVTDSAQLANICLSVGNPKAKLADTAPTRSTNTKCWDAEYIQSTNDKQAPFMKYLPFPGPEVGANPHTVVAESINIHLVLLLSSTLHTRPVNRHHYVAIQNCRDVVACCYISMDTSTGN